MGTEITLPEMAVLLSGMTSAAILPHVDPDGDTLGSCLALSGILSALGVKTEVITEDGLSKLFQLLDPGDWGSVRDFSRDPDILPGQYDGIVAVDAGSPERLGNRRGFFEKGKLTINIDHHRTNTLFGMYYHVDRQASSSGEMVYRLSEALGVTVCQSAATALYAAIATDTGGFRYSNTRPETHRVAAAILDCGLTMDLSELNRLMFERSTYGKAILSARAVTNMRFYAGGLIALTRISLKEMKLTEATEEDCDGIVNIGRNMEGVEVSVFLREREAGDLKVNLRSNGSVDVSRIAAFFGGGGHERAAGFSFRGEMPQIIPPLLEKIQEGLVAR